MQWKNVGCKSVHLNGNDAHHLYKCGYLDGLSRHWGHAKNGTLVRHCSVHFRLLKLFSTEMPSFLVLRRKKNKYFTFSALFSVVRTTERCYYWLIVIANKIKSNRFIRQFSSIFNLIQIVEFSSTTAKMLFELHTSPPPQYIRTPPPHFFILRAYSF